MRRVTWEEKGHSSTSPAFSLSLSLVLFDPLLLLLLRVRLMADTCWSTLTPAFFSVSLPVSHTTAECALEEGEGEGGKEEEGLMLMSR